MSDVVDIMLYVERSTIEQACNILIALGYSDTFYSESGVHTVQEYYDAADKAGVLGHLAEDIQNITFCGGPHGNSWHTLNLQCLLEDHVAQSICVYGSQAVARSLDITI